MMVVTRILSGMLCIMLLFCCTISVFADTLCEDEEYARDDELSLETTQEEAYFYLETEQKHFASSENVEVTYYVNSKEDITDIS